MLRNDTFGLDVELVCGWLWEVQLGEEVVHGVGFRWESAVSAVGRFAGGPVAGEHADVGVVEEAVAGAEDLDCGKEGSGCVSGAVGG